MKEYPEPVATTDKVAESAVLYATLQPLFQLKEMFNDRWKISELIREGVSYSLFDIIKSRSPFNLTDWAGFLNISYKSMLRYNQDQDTFKAIHSEKIIEIAEVTELGLEVFGNVKNFKNWMNKPSYALGGLAPRALLVDSYGKELVLRELTAIEYGLFA